MTNRSVLRRLAKLGLALALVSGLALLGRPLVARAANTYTVTTNGDGAVASCSSFSCTDLRDAVAAAAAGDSIVFASSANGTITLTNGVMLIPVANLTITGNGQANTIISGNSVTQIFGDTSGALTLANLSLKDGDGALGGDIKTTSDLTLNNVSATGGVAPTPTTTGGVIWSQGRGSCITTTTLNNSTINGQAGNFGGAIFGDNVTLNSSTVTGTAGSGGAIWSQCTTTVSASTVTGSTGAGEGGAIFLIAFSSNVSSITDSTINGGTASDGGGIFLTFGDGCGADQLNITRSTITGGKASVSGGGIYNEGGLVTLTNSTVSGNTATTSGGGIYDACTLTSVESTIANNTSPSGSGIETGFTGQATLTATIMADTAATECHIDVTGSFNSGGYNIDDGNTCGFATTGDQHNTATLLGPLQSNGGPTQTMGLPPGSAAIAQIPLGAGSKCQTTDQRGVNRAQASANDNKCDVGALEVVSTTTTLTGPSTVVAGNPVTITATITESVVLAGAKPTGTVTFTDNGAALGTAVSDPGTAVLTTSALIAGTHTISAKYPGTGIFDPSNGPLTITVSIPIPATGASAASLTAPSMFGGGALLLGGLVAVGEAVRRRRSSRRRPSQV